MSATDLKWEIGIVGAYEPFEDFDRFGQLGAAYAGLDDDKNEIVNDDAGITLTMNSSQASDWAEDPFYLSGTLNSTLPGNEIVLGPSSDSDYDGSVEWATVSSVSGTTVTLTRSGSQQHVAYPYSKYSNGDQVLIRTVPLGWSTGADFSAQNFMVTSARRYHERDSLVEIAGGGATYWDHTEYRYRNGVYIACNTATPDTGRYIEKYFPVNSFNPRIRRWRISYDYRIIRATANDGASAPSSIDAKTQFGLATADGDLLYNIDFNTNPDEASWTDVNTLGSYAATVEDWTTASFLASPFGTTDTDNDWDFNSTDDPENSAANRGNRWYAKLLLEHGVNTALEVDNLIIEHAHGTSNEASGYYTIDDYPDQDSLQWEQIRHSSGRQRLLNGALKVNNVSDLTPRYRFSVEFTNVSSAIYRDLIALLEWQKRGHKLSVRPFSSELPSVMVGYMTLEPFDTRNWDLGKVSFLMDFEEA